METIREAQVISLDDPTKKGLIQVRIFPEMIDLKNSDLPWAAKYSIGTGISSSNGVHELPEVNSYIRVVIEDWPFLQRIRYITDDYVEGLYIYSKASSLAISELGAQTYPQPFFKCYKDGTLQFHNTETGEHGVFFKGGGYFLYDANGNFFLNAKSKGIKVYNDHGKIELKADGEIDLNGSTKQFVTWAELNTAVNSLMTLLNAHVHQVVSVGSATLPTTTSTPPITFSMDISAAKTTTVLTSG